MEKLVTNSLNILLDTKETNIDNMIWLTNIA